MRAVLLVVLLATAGCLSSSPDAPDDVVAPESEPEPTPEAPPAEVVAFSWLPIQPVADEAVLFEATGGPSQVVWLIGAQRLEGRIVQTTLAEGVHHVAVRIDGEVHHDNVTVRAAPVEEDPVPEEEPLPDVPAPENTTPPIIQAAQQRNRVSFSIDWHATPSRIDWFFGDGVTSNQQEPTHDYLGTGTFTVRAVVWLADARHEPANVQIEVEDVPLSIILQRDGTAVTVQSNWDQPDAAYTWDFGDGATASGSEAGHEFATAGPHTITLQGMAGDDAETTQTTVFFDDFPLTADVELDDNIAAFTSAWGFEDVAYQWYFGDGVRSNDPTPTHRYPAVGTYTVTLQVRAGDVVNATSFDVTIHSMKLQIDGGLDIHHFTATATWDLTATGYDWRMGDGTTFDTVDVDHNYTTLGPYTVVVVATDGTYIERAAMLVTVWTLPPEIQFDLPPGNVASFGYTWTHPADVVTWDFDDQTTSNEHAPIHIFEDGIGVYDVHVTLSNPDLRAVGVEEVSGNITVKVLYDGVPQFNCGGTPVYEPHDTFGSMEGLAWGAFKDGNRLAVVWPDATHEGSIDIRQDGAWVTYEDEVDGFHVFVQDGHTIGDVVCFRIGDELHALRMSNAFNEHDGDAYLINLLVYAPEALHPDLLAAGMEGHAVRLHDAGDGHLRRGLTIALQGWTAFEEAVATPASGSADACVEGDNRTRGTFAAGACQIFDVQFAYATDPSSAGFTSINGIEEADGIIFIDGADEIQAAPDDPGQIREIDVVVTHELGHYALNMGDRYIALPEQVPYPPLLPVYACYDGATSVSVMGSSRLATEFDGPGFECPDTPWKFGPDVRCQDVPWSDLGVPEPPGCSDEPVNPAVGSGPGDDYVPSWTELREKYPLVPDRQGAADAGPFDDGGLHTYVRWLVGA